tara:strand:- start:358 stop:669 length:312 start_codon:yes stop_codon:yes gene_type:complete
MDKEFKLYVGGLPWEAKSEDLQKFFEAAGITPDKVDILMDTATNRSRGFGFVLVSSQEDLDKAVAELDGKEFEVGGNSRTLTVNEARPREDRGGNGGGGGGNW